MKVYCRNCKHDSSMFLWPSEWCNYEDHTAKKDDFTGTLIRAKSWPTKKMERNKDGNCKYYQRKWWKLWVV